jgi:hypothetical protein
MSVGNISHKVTASLVEQLSGNMFEIYTDDNRSLLLGITENPKTKETSCQKKSADQDQVYRRISNTKI